MVVDEEMIKVFNLDRKRKRADRAGHFPGCNWIIVEAKGRYNIAKAVEQLRETLDQIDAEKFHVKYLAVVYDSLGAESRVFTTAERSAWKVLWNKAIGKGKPVTIKGIEVIALRQDEIQNLYKQRRVTSG